MKILVLRFFAYFIDSVLIYFVSTLFFIITAAIYLSFGRTDYLFRREIFYYSLFIFLYSFLCDSKLNNSTFGKKLCRLKVISFKSNKFSLYKSIFLRTILFFFAPLLLVSSLLQIISFIIGLFSIKTQFLNLDFLFAAVVTCYLFLPLTIIFGPEKQGYHDWLANTAIIRNTQTRVPLIGKQEIFNSFRICILICILIFTSLLILFKSTGQMLCNSRIDEEISEKSLTSKTKFEKIFDITRGIKDGRYSSEGEFLAVDILKEPISRNYVTKVLSLPEEMKSSILSFGFSLTYTEEPFELVNQSQVVQFKVLKGVPVLTCLFFLEPHAYHNSFIKGLIIKNTLLRIKKIVLIIDEIPLIKVKFGYKVNAGWVDMGYGESFYIVNNRDLNTDFRLFQRKIDKKSNNVIFCVQVPFLYQNNLFQERPFIRAEEIL